VAGSYLVGQWPDKTVDSGLMGLQGGGLVLWGHGWPVMWRPGEAAAQQACGAIFGFLRSLLIVFQSVCTNYIPTNSV
jgi:hypothetical protein